MEYLNLIFTISFLIFSGYLLSKRDIGNAIYSLILAISFGVIYVLIVKEQPIEIKSSEKLELIETVITKNDTIYKYIIKTK